MKTREKPREDVPDRRPYLRIQAGDREWTFRLPPERKQIEIVQLMAELAKGPDEDIDRVELSHRQAAGLGVVIGRCWHDVEFDLEAVENGIPVAFGEAVNDELYEEGFPLGVAVALGGRLVQECSASMVGREQAEALLNFTARRPPAGSTGSV